jgi:hypothetical protein
MTHIRNATATLALTAATSVLLAVALAGSPAARADDPFTDIVNYVQNSISIGQADYSAAASDFSTTGLTNEGLIAAIAGFDNTFISSADYTLLGLTAAGTGTDFSLDGSVFDVSLNVFPLNAVAEQAAATTFLSDASIDFSLATSAFSGGEYFLAVEDSLFGSYNDILAGQAETLAALFSAGV